MSVNIKPSKMITATVLLIVATFTAAPVIKAELLESQFITRLDHSRAQDLRTVSFVSIFQKPHMRSFAAISSDPFLQTYHANLDHYEHGGPFYINIKDVNDVSTRWIEDSLMVDIAVTSKAALFTFDQRYYGTNIPTEYTYIRKINY